MNKTVQESSVGVQAIAGIFWVFALRAVNLICEGLRLIVLARFLAPADFGLFGIAILGLSVLEVLSETGFLYALIHKRGNIENYFDTAWTLILLRGVAVTILLFWAAPWIGGAFDTPAAVPIIRAIALAGFFKNALNIRVVLFEKELRFHQYFSFHIWGSIATCSISILAVLITPSVWALVWGFLAGNITRCVMSYVISDRQPRLELRREKIVELWRFSKWITGSTILLFLLTQCDDWSVGFLLGAQALGLYQLAYRLANIPQSEITHFVSKVTFPAYAKVCTDPAHLRQVFERVMAWLLFACLPITGLFSIFARELISNLLGAKWLPMAPVLSILAIFGFLRALDSATGALFMAIGRPEVRTKLQCLQLIVLLGALLPLTVKYGIIGTAMAATGSALISNPIAVLFAFRLMSVQAGAAARMIFVALLGTGLFLTPLGIYVHYVNKEVDLLKIAIYLSLGLLLYCFHGYFALIKPLFGSLKRLQKYAAEIWLDGNRFAS